MPKEHFPFVPCVVSMLLFSNALTISAVQAQEKQPWRKLYTGEQATGENVIALWQFLPGEEARDNSGHGHDLRLRGDARFVENGLFGACLESFPAGQDNDKAQGAFVKNHPSLSPPGAFTLEAWFKPKPEMDKCNTVFLLDKKYYHYAKDIPQANWDYCLYMRRAGENKRNIIAYLGYGKDSAQFTSRTVEVKPGDWYHVAFTYDGEGTGRFFFNGESVGRTMNEGRGPITPGEYGLAIGDRYGSIHQGFPGYIDQVRISNGIVPFFTGKLEVEVSGGRTAFIRMEKDASVQVVIINDTGKALTDVKARTSLGGNEKEISLPDIGPKQTHTIEVSVDTTVRPGRYTLKVSVAAAGTDKKPVLERSEGYAAKMDFSVVIVPRPLPHKMPVVMWGGGDFKTLKEIGFTHNLFHLVDYAKVWEAGEPTEAATPGRIAELARKLDEYLTEGLGAAVYLYPGRWVMTNNALKDKFKRVDRAGKPLDSDNACASLPELQQFAYNVGASVVKSFGDFPGLQASLIHSEIRDGTNLCFHERDREAFRNLAGYDIPREVVSKGGVRYTAIKGFPINRILPDDDRLLTFYRWFWKEGDGWNSLHTQVHKGLKSTGRDDLWTWFDPAVRVPSIWGSGGGVDVISQWTYSYPDPIKIGQATDELFAMAAGRPGQKVMKMTQIIWYRSGTAPKLPEDESKRAQWEKDIPDARFVTIAPDHLREAFWSEISRPVQGIMYHGWGSLVEAGAGGYRFTNPKTRDVLTELVRDVVRPLGPTFLQVPDRKSDVAILESFASQIFAGRGTRGWSQSWEADVHLILQWAHIQPRIIYDETVVRDGLDDFRVLVMPYCDVLTKSVARKVKEFQKRGGVIIADEQLTPALSPDILVQSYRRTKKADKDKAALQEKAADLRRELDPFYERYGDSSDPDVVARFRQYGNTDYLFALNDKRTFGDYVGHHGLVMEKGLPNSSTLSVKRKRGYVYDLVAHKRVSIAPASNGLKFDASFGPGAGRVFMITSTKIADVRINAPAQARLGAQVNLDIAVVDDDGKPIDAVTPVQVEILDPKNRSAEFSGYYGAKDGKLAINIALAGNDLAGEWTIRVNELASDLSREHKLTVRR